MAWPRAGRGSSGSRRDARGRLFGLTLSLAAVTLGLALFVTSRFAPARLAGLRIAALHLSAPVWMAIRGPVETIAGAVADAGDYWDAIRRVQNLQRELVAARREAVRAVLFEAENRRLKHLLRFAEADQRRIAVARIVGGSGASLVETAVVSAGSGAGVIVGQPVITDAGLLGRVTEVAPRAARVLLVSDNESRVPVRVVRTGAPAVLAGTGGGMTELRFVGAGPDAAPKVGDLVVTSGEGGLFAPDVPVARVVTVAGDTARARPLARPDTLGLAVIDAAWLPAPAPAAVRATAAGAQARPIRMAAMINP